MKYRAGYAVLIGEANVGKSTLANVLTQELVAIVSPKPQTTRQRVDGIVTGDDYQLIVVDAPGWVGENTDRLRKFLADEINESLLAADILVLCVGPYSDNQMTRQLFQKCMHLKKPTVLVGLQAMQNRWISANLTLQELKGQAKGFLEIAAEEQPEKTRKAVIGLLKPLLPESDGPLFDEEQFTTQNLRQLATEYVREQCFLQLDEEVPYGLAVLVRSFQEDQMTQKGVPITKISADIVVEKESHRPIVIGAGGQRIKAIGEKARKKVEKLLGQQVHLQLHVKVRDGWLNSHLLRREFGYELAKP